MKGVALIASAAVLVGGLTVGLLYWTSTGESEAMQPISTVAPDPRPSPPPSVPPATTHPMAVPADRPPSPPTLRVSGNRLVDEFGRPFRLAGVNRSGTEYACAQGWGIFDGAADRSFVRTIKSWGANSVRIGLNEHCWLGINGVSEEWGGAAYRQAVTSFVDLLHEEALVAVISLMWSDAGDELALGQAPGPNQDHSADLWRSVAATFTGQPGILFELYGEPHGISWKCLRDGCITDAGFPVEGMQRLLDTVRATGASEPVVVNGLEYANDLSRWLEFRPHDAADQVVAGFHVYNFNRCTNVACWNEVVAPVHQVVPVAATEFGEDTCNGEFAQSWLDWADGLEISYLAWTFNAWSSCEKGPTLIVSEDGTPTPYGRTVRDHFLQLQ